MAIPFLNNINLDDNQLQNAKLHVTSSAPTTAAGQIYFDSTVGTETAKYYDGTQWISLIQYTPSNSTFINLAEAGSDATRTLTASLSATGTPSASTYLRGDNTWATITDIDTTYDLSGYGSTNGTAGIQLVGSDATTDQVAITGSGTTTVTHSANTITVTSNDQYTGTVTSVGTANSTFISGSGGPITTTGSLTYSLSASGTPSASTYLRGDNTWAALPADNNWYVTGASFNTGDGVLTITGNNAAVGAVVDLDGRYLTGNQTITLSGEVTGSGTTSISTTVANNVLDINNFTAATIVTEAEGIENNDNDTTIPTSAAVKDYVDSAVVGGLVYQGGYDASTNTPNLDSPPTGTINKGFTYTVTADGLFFTEQVRVGDVLIAEVDTPTSLADWTTVQNNVDLATLTTVGIGNVNSGTGIGVSYSSGTATVSNTGVTSLTAGEGIDISASTGAITVSGEDSSATNKGIVIVAGGTGVNVSYSSGTATVSADYTNNSYAATISASGTVTHSLGTSDVVVQLYDTVTMETVYADVERSSVNAVDITFASTPTNSIRVLVLAVFTS